MKHFFKLENAVMHHDWGSPRMIPDLVGDKNPEGVPWAELWMGVHPGGPSLCIDDEKHRTIRLPDLIRENSAYYLGEEALKSFGTLPFLYKVLAAEKPLSIQAHPDLEQAKEGWERENRAGIDIKAAERNYKDANHKPEILCALSPFTAMCGFRTPAEIEKLINIMDCSALDNPLAALKDKSPEGGLRGFLGALFALTGKEREFLSAHILSAAGELSRKAPEYKKEWELMLSFVKIHPGDPSVIAPLYLNVLVLYPGEAIYLPAGILHAYVYGLGMELMSNSDNVLRGGLTTKYVDVEELKRVLVFKPFMPGIIKPASAEERSFMYKTESRDFELRFFRSEGETIAYTEHGPSIIFVSQGNLTIRDSRDGAELSLTKGESAFLPPADRAEGITLQGNFRIFAACTGLH